MLQLHYEACPLYLRQSHGKVQSFRFGRCVVLYAVTAVQAIGIPLQTKNGPDPATGVQEFCKMPACRCRVLSSSAASPSCGLVGDYSTQPAVCPRWKMKQLWQQPWRSPLVPAANTWSQVVGHLDLDTRLGDGQVRLLPVPSWGHAEGLTAWTVPSPDFNHSHQSYAKPEEVTDPSVWCRNGGALAATMFPPSDPQAA